MTITKDNFVIVYRLNDLDSLELATYYAGKYNMDTTSTNPSANIGIIGGITWEVSGQLLGISCSNTEILNSESDFNTNVFNPIQDALNNSPELQNKTIWGIILGYNVPGGFKLYDNPSDPNGSYDIVSSTSRISRVGHSLSEKIKNKLYNRSIFKSFDAVDATFALICSRIDAPTLLLAKEYVDNAEKLKRQVYANGTFYIDPYSDRAGTYSTEYTNELLDFYNNILPSLNINVWSTTFLDPYVDVSIPYVEDDSFVWSWFSDRGNSSFFQRTNSLRAFFYNADYDGAFTIRDEDDTRWPYLAMSAGYCATAGAMSNPTIEGFLNPTAFFKSLKNGSTIGEAYLFSLPFLDWTMTLFGDPLLTVGFYATESDDEDSIDEDESWYRMSVNLAKATSHLYKKESEIYNILVGIVDLTSVDTDAEVALLNPANELYEQNNESQRVGQLQEITNRLFMYPQKRFPEIVDNIDDYLTTHSFKISRLLNDISGGSIISASNLLDEGWWQFEWTVQDDTVDFVHYHFKLKVYEDMCYTTLAIPYEIDSYSIRNWTYEKEKDIFAPIIFSGVSSSYIGRRIRYESRVDSLLSINEYLTRGETYYYTVTQYDIETGQEYSTRQFSDIIYS